MPHTSGKGKIVYSVDMMIAYINIFKPNFVKININTIDYDLDNKGWGDADISVNDVLRNPKKYKTDHDKIKNADLKYPIIMDTKGNILDGVHRFIKSKLLNKKSIKVYIFDDDLLKKFIINRDGDYNPQIEIYQYIELFNQKVVKPSILTNKRFFDKS